jgi:hypothetical protein
MRILETKCACCGGLVVAMSGKGPVTCGCGGLISELSEDWALWEPDPSIERAEAELQAAFQASLKCKAVARELDQALARAEKAERERDQARERLVEAEIRASIAENR